tara:strand:- start:380 stop:529 length:150 start_codon:yes stop_codon:yes gene_type:complete
MLLYTEEQLETAYTIYRRHQIKYDLSFMSLEHFRLMYEESKLIELPEEY